ncbi:MAG TPA: uracil phosphoribosyltransferase [Tissierellaceae bacterium]
MGKVTILDHPLIKHKLTYIRDINTGSKEFRELVSEVSMLMAYEVTRDMELEEIEIQTPMTKMKSEVIAGKKVGIVPILRAGLGMVDGMLSLIPAAKVGHIGLYRDPETFEPVEYYCKLPKDVEERELIVVDPMLATGGSASAAIGFLKDRGARNIKLVCLLAAPEGIEVLKKDHPDVDIFLAHLDEKLDENAYIMPGLGDAGDRLYGTK